MPLTEDQLREIAERLADRLLQSEVPLGGAATTTATPLPGGLFKKTTPKSSGLFKKTAGPTIGTRTSTAAPAGAATTTATLPPPGLFKKATPKPSGLFKKTDGPTIGTRTPIPSPAGAATTTATPPPGGLFKKTAAPAAAGTTTATPTPAGAAHVHRKAKPKAATARSGDGVVHMKGEVITVSPADMAQIRTSRGEAQTAIGREIDRYVDAVVQGHRQGYVSFCNWYRKWTKAKENASSELAKKICSFLLDKGLEIIFPEEEILIKLLRKAATKAFEVAVDEVGKSGISEGDIQAFLDAVWAAEEHGITKELDVHDKFFDSNAPEVSNAIRSFVTARQNGWDSTEKLPAETLEILKKAGVGAHGAAAATVIAERVLTAHIQAVHLSERGLQQVSNPSEIAVMSEIDALRQEQSLPSVDNRERIWKLERRISPMFRTMCDINNDVAAMIHHYLQVDHDEAEAIEASRTKVGPFRSSNDLLTRKLLSAKELKRVEGWVVCH